MWIALIASIPLIFGTLATWIPESGPLQKEPDWVSRQSDRAWQSIALRLMEESRSHHRALEKELQAAAHDIPESDFPNFQRDADLSVKGTYGHLPEVYADQGFGAILPAPSAPPTQISWYGMARDGRNLIQGQERFRIGLDNWRHLQRSEQTRRFTELSGAWETLSARLATLSRHARYLETWRTQLEAQWLESERSKIPAFQYLLIGALMREDADLLDQFRADLRPTRIMKRSFLPDVATGLITLPIATDVTDRRFLAEVEGALDTHWNQSSWAKAQKVTFRIRWTRVPKDLEFAAGRTQMDEHLARFPTHQASMTTGGLSTYVRGQSLVFGPGRIQPRTIAHELGHILGFGDCYFRTLSGRGLYGLVVLEWDNPLYPDDLMCDNIAGAARAEVW